MDAQRTDTMGARAEPRPPTALDEIRGESEHITHRLSNVLSTLGRLEERVFGPVPSAGESAMKETLDVSGFVPGAKTALERAHGQINDIEGSLERLSQAI